MCTETINRVFFRCTNLLTIDIALDNLLFIQAVLFYMLLPDGNSDDLTQHAALPVIKGEKWMSNLWIWDPFKA